MVYIAYAKAEASGYTTNGLKMTSSGSATASGVTYYEAYSLAKEIATKIAQDEVDTLVNVTNEILSYVLPAVITVTDEINTSSKITTLLIGDGLNLDISNNVAILTSYGGGGTGFTGPTGPAGGGTGYTG